MSQSLPPLVYVIEMPSINSISHEGFQDHLTKMIMETDKNDLGKVVFG